MNITEGQAKKVRELVTWLGARTECTREAAASAVGMKDDREFKLCVWWPAIQVLWASGTAYRSLGGGGKYAVTDWHGKWKTANKTHRAARAKFSRAAMRLPSQDEVPPEKHAALARAVDRMGHADLLLLTKEHAREVRVAAADYTGLLGCETTTKR